jgi:hypothetical protein
MATPIRVVGPFSPPTPARPRFMHTATGARTSASATVRPVVRTSAAWPDTRPEGVGCRSAVVIPLARATGTVSESGL